MPCSPAGTEPRLATTGPYPDTVPIVAGHPVPARVPPASTPAGQCALPLGTVRPVFVVCWWFRVWYAESIAQVDGEEEIVEPRLSMSEQAPRSYAAMRALEGEVRRSVDPALHELIKIRASQLNGCAFCLDMHTKDARQAGESEQRIYALNAWWEAPFFSERERAALALTEAVTNVQGGHVPDEVYDRAAGQFDQAELASLIWAVGVINVWNRVAIASRAVPGTYEPELTR